MDLSKLARGPFKFNLLPPKSEAIVELEIERDDSIFYSMLLVFVAGLAFFGVTAINYYLVEPKNVEFDTSIAEREKNIGSYSDIRTKNGELVVKTRTLAPVLDKMIDTTQIFRVGDEIAESLGTRVLGYGRERSGEFLFVVSTSSITEVVDLVTNVRAISGVSNVYFRETRYIESSSNYHTTIALIIDGA